MTTLTVENYLKAVWQLALRTEHEWVVSKDLAQVLAVSPGTVTSMMKTLAESGLAEYRPYEGIRLTDTGRSTALRIVRRHRLIELFLVQSLGLTWDQVHEEAEHMEHAVSDFLIDQIDAYLGHPVCDPHGDPIPAADGAMRSDGTSLLPLSAVPIGSSVRIARVTNQDSEFLRFLTDSGCRLHEVVTIRTNSPAAGVVTVSVAERDVTLGYPAAAQVLVEALTPVGTSSAAN